MKTDMTKTPPTGDLYHDLGAIVLRTYLVPSLFPSRRGRWVTQILDDRNQQLVRMDHATAAEAEAFHHGQVRERRAEQRARLEAQRTELNEHARRRGEAFLARDKDCRRLLGQLATARARGYDPAQVDLEDLLCSLDQALAFREWSDPQHAFAAQLVAEAIRLGFLHGEVIGG